MKYIIGVENLSLKVLGKDVETQEKISETILINQIESRCYLKIKQAIQPILDEAQRELNNID